MITSFDTHKIEKNKKTLFDIKKAYSTFRQDFPTVTVVIQSNEQP